VAEDRVDIRDLRDGGFLWLDKEALELVSRKTGNTGVIVYSWLCYYANSKAQDCFPSITTLAKHCHTSRRTIMRELKKLEDLGLISIQRIKGKSNIYRLLDVEKPVDKTGDMNVTSDIRGDLPPKLNHMLVEFRGVLV
jgi:DNA-binding transcriptional ArsR family regulator